MYETVELKGNLYWEKSNNGSDFYIPYTIINGKRYKLLGVFVDKLEFENGDIYRLCIDFMCISDHHSFQSATVKAEEILRDFKFRKDVNGKYLYIAYENDENNYKIRHTIIGWKKAYGDSYKELIVKVRIPRGTRCNLTSTKCRAEKAEILEVYTMIHEPNPKSVKDKITLQKLPKNTDIYSIYSVKMYKDVAHRRYNVGDTLEIKDFNTTSATCASGIHFFRSVEKAINFKFQ